jgi:hypothetical protein
MRCARSRSTQKWFLVRCGSLSLLNTHRKYDWTQPPSICINQGRNPLPPSRCTVLDCLSRSLFLCWHLPLVACIRRLHTNRGSVFLVCVFATTLQHAARTFLPSRFNCGSSPPHQDTKHPPRMSRVEREALFHKCANTMTSESISSWFLRAPGHRIYRDNVIDWLLWALFSARTTEILEEWEQELDYYITVMGEYVGYPLRPGGESEIQCLRLTLDPVHMVHRPFVWYMVRYPTCKDPSPLLYPVSR